MPTLESQNNSVSHSVCLIDVSTSRLWIPYNLCQLQDYWHDRIQTFFQNRRKRRDRSHPTVQAKLKTKQSAAAAKSTNLQAVSVVGSEGNTFNLSKKNICNKYQVMLSQLCFTFYCFPLWNDVDQTLKRTLIYNTVYTPRAVHGLQITRNILYTRYTYCYDWKIGKYLFIETGNHIVYKISCSLVDRRVIF